MKDNTHPYESHDIYFKRAMTHLYESRGMLQVHPTSPGADGLWGDLTLLYQSHVILIWETWLIRMRAIMATSREPWLIHMSRVLEVYVTTHMYACARCMCVCVCVCVCIHVCMCDMYERCGLMTVYTCVYLQVKCCAPSDAVSATAMTSNMCACVCVCVCACVYMCLCLWHTHTSPVYLK